MEDWFFQSKTALAYAFNPNVVYPTSGLFFEHSNAPRMPCQAVRSLNRESADSVGILPINLFLLILRRLLLLLITGLLGFCA